MKVKSDVLLVEEEPVRRVPLEVGPDEFGGIEFRCVSREPFDVEARIVLAQAGQFRPLVNRSLVPEQDDRPAEVMQELAKEVGDVTGVEVVLLETNVEAHPFSLCGNREGGQGGDAVMLEAVSDNRHLAAQSPRAAPSRNEQESALIEEYQMSG